MPCTPVTSSFFFSFTFFIQQLSAQLVERDLIIIGGGATQQDAEKAKTSFKSIPELSSQFQTKLQLIKSDTIKGLNPGFHIAILGYSSDPVKTTLMLRVCNQYLSGVYKKKVQTRQTSGIHFKPIKQAMEGNPFFLNLDGIENVFFERNSAESIIPKRRESKVIVNEVEPVFQQKLGPMLVSYYRGWIQESKDFVYLSQFQFSSIQPIGQLEPLDCNTVERELKMGENFTFTEMQESCEYEDRTTVMSNGYESNWESIIYDNYSFEEVLNYHIGRGDFEISQLDQNGKWKDEEEEGCSMELGTSHIIYECHFEGYSNTKISVKNGTVIFSTGGGV